MSENTNAANARRWTAALSRLIVRKLRDEHHLSWNKIGKRIGITGPSAKARYRHSKRRNGAVQQRLQTARVQP